MAQPTYEELLEFVRNIARWPIDGEDNGDGEVYRQASDDAHDTVESLIGAARALLGQED